MRLAGPLHLTVLVNIVHNGWWGWKRGYNIMVHGVYKLAYVHCGVGSLTRSASILAVGATGCHDNGPDYSHPQPLSNLVDTRKNTKFNILLEHL